METLRFSIGDLAISVGRHLPENTGNIVKIIGVDGYQDWFGITGQTFVWIVERNKDSPIVFENSDGSLTTSTVGPVPDEFLIPIGSNHGLVLHHYDLAREACKECELLAETDREPTLENKVVDRYSPIESCMKKFPNLTKEEIMKRAADFGF